MKFSHFINRLEKENAVAGIECYWNGNSMLYNMSHLKKKNNKVEQVAALIGENSLENISKSLPKGIPVIIIVTGKSVLSRLVEVDADKNDSNILNKLIPNANLNDFCLSYGHSPVTSSGEYHVSVIRKQLLLEIYSNFEKTNLSVVGCLLGALAVDNISENFNFNNEQNVLASNHFFTITGNRIVAYKKLEHEISHEEGNFGGMQINGESLLAYVAALHYFYFGYTNFPTNSDFLTTPSAVYSSKLFFMNSMKIILFSAFGILLINFIAFQQINKQLLKKSQQYEGYQEGVFEFNRLQSEFGLKFEFMKQNGLLTPPKASFYIDKIASSIPDKIMLTSLKVYPRKDDQTGADDDGLHFDNDKIVVSGNCKRSYDLNIWIKLLNNYKWIEKIVVSDFIQNNSSEPGRFTLEFKLK